MYYKKIVIPVLLLLSILLLSSCAETKKVAYFQQLNTSADSLKVKKISPGLYDARIKPKDLLSISVVTSEPMTSRIYNLLVPSVYDASNLTSSAAITSQPSLQPYLVDNEGMIDFPVFGKIQVAGLTSSQLEALLQQKMASAFSKETPIITIRIINYAVNILGEVQRPGKYNSVNERMTIFEGLAMAGDLTIYGRRDNVIVLRENAEGAKQFIKVNLNDANIINSPAYYLEQNDVVYVEPNRAKSRNSNFGVAENLAISAVSILISMVSLAFNVLK